MDSRAAELCCGHFSQELHTCTCMISGRAGAGFSLVSFSMEFSVSANGIAARSPAALFTVRPPPGLLVNRSSPSKRRRDHARASAHLRWTKGKQDDDKPPGPSSAFQDEAGPMAKVERAVEHFLHSRQSHFGVYFQHWSQVTAREAPDGRQRDIFPIGLVHAWSFDLKTMGAPTGLHLLLLNACIASLNFLAFDYKHRRLFGTRGCKHTKQQMEVIRHVADRVAMFL